MSLTEIMIESDALNKVYETDNGVCKHSISSTAIQVCKLKNGNKVVTATDGNARIMMELDPLQCKHLARLLFV